MEVRRSRTLSVVWAGSGLEEWRNLFYTYTPFEVRVFVGLDIGVDWSDVVLSVSLDAQFGGALLGFHRLDGLRGLEGLGGAADAHG